jgi:hypothetical protein
MSSWSWVGFPRTLACCHISHIALVEPDCGHLKIRHIRVLTPAVEKSAPRCRRCTPGTRRRFPRPATACRSRSGTRVAAHRSGRSGRSRGLRTSEGAPPTSSFSSYRPQSFSAVTEGLSAGKSSSGVDARPFGQAPAIAVRSSGGPALADFDDSAAPASNSTARAGAGKRGRCAGVSPHGAAMESNHPSGGLLPPAGFEDRVRQPARAGTSSTVRSPMRSTDARSFASFARHLRARARAGVRAASGTRGRRPL